MLTFENKSLACSDCDNSFVFSADEQQFFATKGLLNEPKRCPDCRVVIRLKRDGKEPNQASKVSCADCGVLCVVPFTPTGCKPVYCGACFRTRHSRNVHWDQRELVPAG
jgi:CxxC-x17-CxxC domain-containing protein